MEMEENIDVQKKGWVIQRVGWIVMAVFVAMAAFGFFGDGIVSKKNIQSGVQKLEYQKYSRFESAMELKFDLNSATQQNIISFPVNYLGNFRIESILPEPKQNQSGNERVNYVFEGNGPMKIIFYLVPKNIGELEADVFVNNQRFHFNHFIYP